jgi:hypothetical protein
MNKSFRILEVGDGIRIHDVQTHSLEKNSILLVCLVLSRTLPHHFVWFLALNVTKLLPSFQYVYASA